MSEQNVQVTRALEPCPFCGNRSPMRWKPHNVGDPVPSVWCEDCGAEVTPHSHHPQQDAIAAWNHRTRAETDLVEAWGELASFIEAHVPVLRGNPLVDAMSAALSRSGEGV